MPNNQKSWKQEMKHADFHNKFELNTNPAHGRTYIPKGTKVESPTKTNLKRSKDIKTVFSNSNGGYSEGGYVKEREVEYTGLDAIAVDLMRKYDLPEDDWYYSHIVKDALKEMYNKGINSLTTK